MDLSETEGTGEVRKLLYGLQAEDDEVLMRWDGAGAWVGDTHGQGC